MFSFNERLKVRMTESLVNVAQNIRFSALSVFDEKTDIIQDGVIGGHHGEDEKGGKGQAPHDGRGQGRPENGFSSQAEGHGSQSGDGGDAGEDDGPHAHVTGANDGRVYLVGMFPAVSVDKIDQDQGVIDHNTRKGQKADEGDEGQRIVAHQQPDQYPPGMQRGW